MYSRRKELENSIETLRMELNRQPEEEEIASRLGVRVEEYRAILDDLKPVIFVPLHQMMEGDDEFTQSQDQYTADITQKIPAKASDAASYMS